MSRMPHRRACYGRRRDSPCAKALRRLGRISIRPRAYQFVPLLMALRQTPVRLLIADDVGVGKTIEALLIARELWDRGDIRRMAVLCPPYLCEQWQSELRDKFSLEAEIVRSGTVGRLERSAPPCKPTETASSSSAMTDRWRSR